MPVKLFVLGKARNGKCDLCKSKSAPRFWVEFSTRDFRALCKNCINKLETLYHYEAEWAKQLRRDSLFPMRWGECDFCGATAGVLLCTHLERMVCSICCDHCEENLCIEGEEA